MLATKLTKATKAQKRLENSLRHNEAELLGAQNQIKNFQAEFNRELKAR